MKVALYWMEEKLDFIFFAFDTLQVQKYLPPRAAPGRAVAMYRSRTRWRYVCQPVAPAQSAQSVPTAGHRAGAIPMAILYHSCTQ